MTLKKLSDKENKTIYGGGTLFNWCGYECGVSFILTSTFLHTWENVKDIFARARNLMPPTL